MPPKPWELKKTAESKIPISEIIQSTAPPKEDTPTVPLTTQQNNKTSLSSYGGLGSSYGGLGSMYGGGLGGYGGMYGGGMYGGGYGGMGMMGMMDGQQPQSIKNFVNVVRGFESLVYILGMIGQSLEQNVEGLRNIKKVFKDLFTKYKEKVVQFISYLFEKLKDFYRKLKYKNTEWRNNRPFLHLFAKLFIAIVIFCIAYFFKFRTA